MTNFKDPNCGKNQKNQIVTKLKKSNCDKTQNLKLWQNLKTQILTKLKTPCDKTKKVVSDIF